MAGVPAQRASGPGTALRRAGLAARAGLRLARHHRRAPAAPDLGPLAAALRTQGADAAVVAVPGRRATWTPSGVTAVPGAALTWLAAGGTSMLGLPLGPGPQLRLREGGRVHAGPGATATATAAGGPVDVVSAYPGEPSGPDGALVHDGLPHAVIRGGFAVVVAAWPPGTDVAAALRAAAAADPSGLAGAEAARLAAPALAPPGWTPHWAIAPAGCHTASGEGIAVRTHGDVEILCRPVDVPVTETLRLQWRWRVDVLPSAVAEDTLLTHDYVSVALEVDDGHDLTWHWSAALPEGHAYRCPLPHWRHRETHVVVRSGPDGLGEWQDEERPVLADLRAAVGGPDPARVTAVWLIANSTFQRREGRAAFGGITLRDGPTQVRVL